MLHRSRLTFVSFLVLLALVVPTNLVQAQSSPQALTDINVAPSADLAVPDEVAQTVKLRESLSADQISQIQAILDSHKAELQQIKSDLVSLNAPSANQDKKLFLPFVNANGNTQGQAKAADLAVTPEKAEKLSQITQHLTAVQDKIDQAVKSLLTTSQSEVYAKQAAKLKSVGQAIAAKLQATAAQSPEGTTSTTDCFYGAYYGAISRYYAYYGYLYAYYQYYYYGTNYSYYVYIWSSYQWSYLSAALPLAGGAYFDAAYGFGYDYAGWSDTATTDFYYAYYYSYYAYQYAYADYQNTGSAYAYYAYYYEYYSDYYAYYAYAYESSC